MDVETMAAVAYVAGIGFWAIFAICTLFGLLWSFEEVTDGDDVRGL